MMKTTNTPRESATFSGTGKFGCLRRFTASESGAVTTDWVVLSFGLCVLGLACVASVGVGVMDVATDVAALEAPRAAIQGKDGL